MTAEIVALAQEHKHIAVLLGKVKQEKERQKFVEQLTTLDIPLNRIKLKVFGSQGFFFCEIIFFNFKIFLGAGKTRLIQALQRPSSASSLNSLVESVSRRFSGSLFLSSSSTTQTGPPLSSSVHSNKGNQNNDCAFSSSTSDEGIHSVTLSTSSAIKHQQQLPTPNNHQLGLNQIIPFLVRI